MRVDGVATYYVVQHLSGPGDRREWVDTALDHVLFRGLSFDQKRGRIGDRFRAIIRAQGPSTDLWQRYGIDGFEAREDADLALLTCRAKTDRLRFRLVCRTMTRSDLVVTR